MIPDADPYDVCAALNLLNVAHYAWADGNEETAVLAVERVRHDYPAILAHLEIGWALGTTPEPGAADWLAWYETEHYEYADDKLADAITETSVAA